MKAGRCALCLEDKELIDSHILPNKAFFGDILSGKGPKRLIPTSSDVNEPLPRKPMQSGPKEPLLCFDCDSVKLGRLDKYFTEFVRQCAGTVIIEDPRWFQVSGVDYASMRLAQLSFLWRMSVASHSKFRHVSLPDEIQERIRRMLLEENPGDPDFYPCVWMHPGTLSDTLRQGVILSPLNGGESLRMFATGLAWLWFLSEKEVSPLAEASIQPEGRMLILKTHESLIDEFGSEVQELIKTMERKPNAEKLLRWGFS